MSERPNFLWLYTEDNNPYIGAYGDPVARTPNIDRLAEEGILFEVAYCPAPTCAPSRFAYLTGISPESIGPAHHMRAVATLPAYIRGFPASQAELDVWVRGDPSPFIGGPICR